MTAVVDLTGPIVLLVRDDPTVAGITTRVRGGELAPGDTAPCVIVRSLANTRSPTGPGKSRLGLQGPRYAVLCFGVTYQQAAQLAGAVSGALHQVRSRTISGKTIHQILDDGWGGPVLDPSTKWITETPVFQVTGSA